MVVPVEVTLSCLALDPSPTAVTMNRLIHAITGIFFMCTGVCHCLAFVAPQAQPTVCYRIYNVYLLSDTDPGRGGEEELSMEFYERDSRKPRPCLMFNNYRCRGVRREPSERFVHAMVGADCFFYRSPPTKKRNTQQFMHLDYTAKVISL